MLGLTKLYSLDWMPAVGLVCVAALECTWHFNHFDPADPAQPLVWYLVFLPCSRCFRFLFLRQFSGKVVPVGCGGYGRAAAVFPDPPAG